MVFMSSGTNNVSTELKVIGKVFHLVYLIPSTFLGPHIIFKDKTKIKNAAKRDSFIIRKPKYVSTLHYIFENS